MNGDDYKFNVIKIFLYGKVTRNLLQWGATTALGYFIDLTQVITLGGGFHLHNYCALMTVLWSTLKHPSKWQGAQTNKEIAELWQNQMKKLLSCKYSSGSSKQLTIKPVIVWLEQLKEIPDRCVCTKQAYLFLHICFPITVLMLHQSKAIQFKYLQAQTIHQVLVELVTSAKDDDESDWAENSSKTSTNTLQNFTLILWVAASISRHTA